MESESLYAVVPEQSGDNGYLDHDGITGFEPVDDVVRSSENADKPSRDEILELLRTEFEEEVGS